MKLSNMIIIFVIIMIPILLIFSLYVSYQIETVALQTTYDTKLVSATRDAITALEMNTFGFTTKDNATSTRRNIQASVNSFTNSYAANFGITGYDKNDILSYVPALLFTMYDGIYIYAPTNDEQDIENAPEENYVLKPYIYYSARYKDEEKYDVVINYSLDNYITITGTVGNGTNEQYISKSGYLIDTSKVKLNGEKVVVDGIELEEEELYEKITFFMEDYNLDGNVSYSPSNVNNPNADDGESAIDFIQSADIGTPITLTCRYCYKNNEKYYYYDGSQEIEGVLSVSQLKNIHKSLDGCWFTYNETGKIIKERPEELNTELLKDNSAIKFYQEAYEFTKEIEGLGITISADTMVKPNGDLVQGLENPNDPYYIFRNDQTNVLDAIGEEDEDLFTQHKLNVMKAIITENLNVAISNYSNAEVSNFYMPEISETEWEKILTNISMVSFVQGMPIGFKTYNNYAIVTSTNNEMYVGEDSIYYVIDSSNENNKTDHHIIECEKIKNAVEEEAQITGYESTIFDKYTVNYVTEPEGNKQKVDHYLHYYKHHSLDCYDCIVNRQINLSEVELDESAKSAKLHAIARIKYNQYKITRDVNSRR